MQTDKASCQSFQKYSAKYKFEYELIKEMCILEMRFHSWLFLRLRVSSTHYLNAGPAGVHHYFFLINFEIDNIETTVCEEFNTAHACNLYKTGLLLKQTLSVPTWAMSLELSSSQKQFLTLLQQTIQCFVYLSLPFDLTIR